MESKHPTETIPPDRQAWLIEGVERWKSDGLIEGQAAENILSRYTVSVREGAARLLLILGTSVFGIGMIWLIASNLGWESMSPFLRAAGAIIFWLALVAAAETIASRKRIGPINTAPLLVAAHLLVALAYGGAIFQVAQSLQVPAFEPLLLAAWSAGALAYAYAVRSVTSLVVGIVVGAGWYLWTLTDSGAAVVLGLALASFAATSVAAVHEHWRIASFSSPWRVAGVIMALIALFAAAIPDVISGSASLPSTFFIGAIPITVLAAVVARKASAQIRRELAATFAVVVAATILVAWSPNTFFDVFSSEKLSGAALAHVLVAGALFLTLSVWVALVGVARHSSAYITLSSIAIIAFVILQSYAVIAPILSGAILFLVAGAVLIVTAVCILRVRNQLAEEIAG